MKIYICINPAKERHFHDIRDINERLVFIHQDIAAVIEELL